jgi:hypothetical protein
LRNAWGCDLGVRSRSRRTGQQIIVERRPRDLGDRALAIRADRGAFLRLPDFPIAMMKPEQDFSSATK